MIVLFDYKTWLISFHVLIWILFFIFRYHRTWLWNKLLFWSLVFHLTMYTTFLKNYANVWKRLSFEEKEDACILGACIGGGIFLLFALGLLLPEPQKILDEDKLEEEAEEAAKKAEEEKKNKKINLDEIKK